MIIYEKTYAIKKDGNTTYYVGEKEINKHQSEYYLTMNKNEAFNFNGYGMFASKNDFLIGLNKKFNGDVEFVTE